MNKISPQKEELNHLKACLLSEVICSRTSFSWSKAVHRALKCPDRRFYFWWRIANYLYRTNKAKKISIHINRNLRNKYGCDLGLGSYIGKNFRISHYVGIVISRTCIIGDNFHILQNTTIGVLNEDVDGAIRIGNNVKIGANCCIISDNITIGDNVYIGAMSFINKDIPANCIVYTPKSRNEIKIKTVKNN
ncbi:serine acetyltransferase [Photorhabdus aegyptia]|uniref:serine acetyltransferase n=1 Tax=Photorhabdus aegyptia TaxID=2805098 RepID=UPI001E2C070A|nr:serine acetyltransferase [Photorhabdus aegyptia]MCC8459561.1 serine acetyltransferase [Photorhabdus aegyptia]